jgi:hypothetical protein
MLQSSPGLGTQLHEIDIMSPQQECHVRNPPSQPTSILGRKDNSATQCANPQCSKELLYFREGTLELLELETHADDRARPDDGAFAMSSLPSRFFWLCGECTKTHVVKRWTTSGLILALRSQRMAGCHPTLTPRPAAGTTRPLPASLTVPSMPPMGHPLHRPPLLVLQRNVLGPKAG